jgi:uracil-DNA glycosylase
MHPSWKEALGAEFRKLYFVQLADLVEKERKARSIFPTSGEVFRAFELPLPAVRVVILGQDPYHGPGQAHGLAFSVKPGVAIPPSLANIYRELQADVGTELPGHGNLGRWVEQGVFLLNSVLTVRSHEAGSHRNMGWETFTDAVIKVLSDRESPLVFILWGAYARAKVALLDTLKHTVIESAHPSPMSARNGFFGSKPFSRTNEALAKAGLPPIDWQLL